MLEPWPQGLQIGFPNQFNGIPFSTLGPIQGHKVQHWDRLKFSISALTPSVKPLGLISIFAPIGMLDLS
jgi:hypothetical protein